MHKLILIILAAMISMPALADDWTKWKAKDFDLDKPPKENSSEQRHELAEMLTYQNSDRKEACAMGRAQKYASYETIFAKSPVLTAIEARKAKPLVHRVMNLTQKISRKFKEEYDRPRPFAVDSKIKPCVPEPGQDKSFPSSHASMGWAGACVLSKIFPAKARALEDYGQYVGDIRTVIGVHFPSDVAAGQELGAEICRRLLADKDFRKELKDLQ